MFDRADSLGDGDDPFGRVRGRSPSFATAAAGGEGHSEPPSQLGHWSEFGPDDPFAVFTDGGNIALPVSGDTSGQYYLIAYPHFCSRTRQPGLDRG